MSAIEDPYFHYRFDEESDRLSNEVQEAAIQEAYKTREAYKSRNKAISEGRAHVVALAICKKAFKNLENVLKQQFPSPDLSFDIKTKLWSKETQFFVPEDFCDWRSRPSLFTRIQKIMLEGSSEAELKGS